MLIVEETAVTFFMPWNTEERYFTDYPACFFIMATDSNYYFQQALRLKFRLRFLWWFVCPIENNTSPIQKSKLGQQILDENLCMADWGVKQCRESFHYLVTSLYHLSVAHSPSPIPVDKSRICYTHSERSYTGMAPPLRLEAVDSSWHIVFHD